MWMSKGQLNSPPADRAYHLPPNAGSPLNSWGWFRPPFFTQARNLGATLDSLFSQLLCICLCSFILFHCWLASSGLELDYSSNFLLPSHQYLLIVTSHPSKGNLPKCIMPTEAFRAFHMLPFSWPSPSPCYLPVFLKASPSIFFCGTLSSFKTEVSSRHHYAPFCYFSHLIQSYDSLSSLLDLELLHSSNNFLVPIMCQRVYWGDKI